MTFPFIIVRDLFDAPVVVVGVPGQEPGVLLVGHQQAGGEGQGGGLGGGQPDPHDDVDEDEDVVGLGKEVPCHRDTLRIQG